MTEGGTQKPFSIEVSVGTVDGVEQKGRNWVRTSGVRKYLKEISWNPDKIYGFRINPLTTILTTSALWIFCAIALSKPYLFYKTMERGVEWIGGTWTWFYIGTQNAWIIFIMMLFFSKHAKLKLGQEDEKPEYSGITWFMMLFSCGVGNELFYFGVAEPIYHYALSAASGMENRYSHWNPTERAQAAMEVTYYHWGMHGWVCYACIGLGVAFMSFRKKLPLTMRSCLYPILGEKCFGPIGDFIDTLSALCTMMGVCTSLGLGTIDVNAGISRLTGCPRHADQMSCEASGVCSWGMNGLGMCKPFCEFQTTKEFCNANRDRACLWKGGACHLSRNAEEEFFEGVPITRDNQIILIWVIASVACISVVSGLQMGIRALSVTCFVLGMFLWTYVLFAGNPWYFLDLFCQQIGMYLEGLLELGFHTDTFARHTRSADIHGEIPNVREYERRQVADQQWIAHWSVFYWGWWIAWSPFVGMFIARISKGRTIREFIAGTMIIPMLYSFTWFTVFGGSGLMMEKVAETAMLTGIESPAYLKQDHEGFVYKNMTCTGPRDTFFEDHPYHTPLKNLEGVTGDDAKFEFSCVYASRVSQRPQYEMWFDMVAQYSDLANLMMPISLLAILLYFTTSSDSGSMVIDTLCSNGHENSPAAQKVYWAMTQAACATALIYVGYADDPDDPNYGKEGQEADGSNALRALQYASLIAGLPYTLFICLLCAALWKGLQYESGELIWDKSKFFSTDLFDLLDFRWTSEWFTRFKRTIIGVIAPWYLLREPLSVRNDWDASQKRFFMLGLSISFYLWPIFLFSSIGEKGLLGGVYLGWWFYMCFVSLLMGFRNSFRLRYGIDGNIVEDWFCCMLVYFFTVDQIDSHFTECPVPPERSSGESVGSTPKKIGVPTPIAEEDIMLTTTKSNFTSNPTADSK